MFLFTLQVKVRYALSGENSKNMLIDKSEIFFYSLDKGNCMKTSWKRLFNSLTYTDADFFFGGGVKFKKK